MVLNYRSLDSMLLIPPALLPKRRVDIDPKSPYISLH